jgi:hypothetical protein
MYVYQKGVDTRPEGQAKTDTKHQSRGGEQRKEASARRKRSMSLQENVQGGDDPARFALVRCFQCSRLILQRRRLPSHAPPCRKRPQLMPRSAASVGPTRPARRTLSAQRP